MIRFPFRPVCLLGFILLAAVPRLGAQLRELPRETVRNIVITNVGPQTVSDYLVRANIRVRVGEPYNRPSVDDDVRNLNATGFFANIRVLEERSDEGVTLIYVLRAKPTITDIQFTGNKKFSQAKLSKKLTTKIGEPLDDRKLFADAQEIKKLYEKSGYPRTDVKYVQNVNEKIGRGAREHHDRRARATLGVAEEPPFVDREAADPPYSVRDAGKLQPAGLRVGARVRERGSECKERDAGEDA